MGAFDALLDTLDPDPAADRIWLAGDLVNRGPDSLGVLRRAMRLGAECVLGNHDLHLLAVAYGARPCGASDTFSPVLEAPDREPLLDWLRRRPLLHHDPGIGWTMVHAGLPPEWDLATARRRAAEVERVLAGEQAAAFLAHLYGDEASEGEAGEKTGSGDGWGGLRYTVNALTRIRCVTADGRLALSFAGPAGSAAAGRARPVVLRSPPAGPGGSASSSATGPRSTSTRRSRSARGSGTSIPGASGAAG